MYRENKARQVQYLFYREGYTRTDIHRELGLAYKTIAKLLLADPNNMPPLTRQKPSRLDPHSEFIETLFMRHKNCDIVREKLQIEKGITISLRRLQQYLKPLREKMGLRRPVSRRWPSLMAN